MKKTTDPVVTEAIGFVRGFFRENADGHDASHTLRVYRTAVALAEAEEADVRTVALAALLHDTDDRKLSPQTAASKENARAFLRRQGVPEEEIARIVRVIGQVSFRENGGAPPESVEAACVRDADRLDAIGAVGIARAFAFGGAHGRPLYAENGAGELTVVRSERYGGKDTVSHFYEKLLLLKDMMATEAGKAEAERRHTFMLSFLEELRAEVGEE